jgi:translation elongation factor P/translation initiation factor 5A
MKPVKELQKGDYILHRGEPYRVLNKENVTFGTHTHTKLKVAVEGLFSGGSEILTLMPHSNVEDVDIIRKKGQVIALQPLQVMDLVSYETFNATSDEELLQQLHEGNEVTFVEFNGTVKVLETR